jgi:AraC-like DNA-binding protein
MISLPMTRAGGMGPLPELLRREAGAGAAEEVFRRCGLPLQLADHPDQRIPLRAMVDLFEVTAAVLGRRTAGLEAGEKVAAEAWGPLGAHVWSATTLKGALHRAVTAFHLHQSVGRMLLKHQNDHVIWGYCRPEVGTPGVQHADHCLPALIRVARSFLGRTWQPAWIDVQYPADPLGDQLECALSSRIRFGQNSTGIAIHRDELASARAAVQLKLPEGDGLPPAPRRPGEQRGFVEAVAHIVGARLLEGRVDIDGAAWLAGMNSRTLQRRLRDAEVSYREVLDHVRLEWARDRISRGAQNITEIALDLGYSTPGNFARAFRRVYGFAPTHVGALAVDVPSGGRRDAL